MSAWLIDILDAALPELVGARRDQIRDAIVEALPKTLIAETIASSAAAVLKQRGIADGAGDLARELGNNCGGSVVLMLQADPIERAFCSDDECAWSGHTTDLVDGERCPTCGSVEVLVGLERSAAALEVGDGT